MKLKILFTGIILLSVILFSSFFALKDGDNKTFAKNALLQADIKIDGDKPWDMTIHNPKLYSRILQQGSLGLGEAYMDGWWDSPSLDQFFCKLLRAELDKKVTLSWPVLFSILKAKLINLQSKDRAFEIGEHHYDLGNDLFTLMLDKHMIYSCGYWKNAKNIDDAQEKKLDLICQKLQLKPGMSMLDIGCGWGGLAYWAAKNYGVNVTGITVSKEQAKFAQEFCKDLPVKIVVQDYRDLNKTFDRIASVGMFEHVGCKNYKEFMKVAHRCLKDDGLFLLHTIGSDTSVSSSDPWIGKYIFPNSMLPSVAQISNTIEGLFTMEDWHNFSADYDKTLMAWFDRFNNSWDTIKSKYDDRFYRMWKYYLLSCAGFFRARKIQLWQIVLAKNGVPGGYDSIR